MELFTEEHPIISDIITALREEVQEQRAELNQLRAKLTAAEALAGACKNGAKFVAKYVADTESIIGKRALDRMEAALRQWEAK